MFFGFEKRRSAAENEYVEAFNMFTKNPDGSTVDFIDVPKLQTIMGALFQNPTETELKEMVREVDRDGNGEIELDEFLRLCQKKRMDWEEEMREAWKIFDRTNSGKVTVADMQAVFESIGHPLTEEECMQLILDVEDIKQKLSGDKKHKAFLMFNDWNILMNLKKHDRAAAKSHDA